MGAKKSFLGTPYNTGIKVSKYIKVYQRYQSIRKIEQWDGWKILTQGKPFDIIPLYGTDTFSNVPV